MQSLLEVTVTRPWHWGIAIVSAPGADLPEGVGESGVASSRGALVLKVRHAQDIDAERFEGHWDWAVASLLVRSLPDFDESTDVTYFDGVIELPEGRLQVGDADGFVTVDNLAPRARVRVSGDFDPDAGATLVRIDFAPDTSSVTPES